MKNSSRPLFLLAVACVTGLWTSQALAQDAVGNAAAGQGKVALCIGCHGIEGYRASFPEVHQVPMISGQGAKYLATALNEYKTGARKHPTMRAIADSLSEQDIADVAAYYAASGAGQPAPVRQPGAASARVTELLQKGNCVSCHGEGFTKPIDPTYPKVAGQHADYLYAALKSYRIDGNANVGRSNPVMGAVAKQFSHAELKVLADYVGSLQGELKVVPESRFR